MFLPTVIEDILGRKGKQKQLDFFLSLSPFFSCADDEYPDRFAHVRLSFSLPRKKKKLCQPMHTCMFNEHLICVS
jgi:hypothetical protein